MNITSLSKIAGLRKLAITAGFLTTLALPAAACPLPAPYVSRALDAVLIPVDSSVRSAFGLSIHEAGLLVLAVEPGGIADTIGIKPGDIIGETYGQVVEDPIKLDAIVYYWINKGVFDFGFDVWHEGTVQYYTSTISLESYTTVIDVTTVSTWSSYSYEGFSYSEYSAEYSTEISETYISSETTIQETITSEEFVAYETTETGNDDPALDTDQDGTPDIADTDDDNDGISDMADADENGDGAVEDPNWDSDNDGTPDMSDTDDDNDGVSDAEDGDDNGDGVDDQG